MAGDDGAFRLHHRDSRAATGVLVVTPRIVAEIEQLGAVASLGKHGGFHILHLPHLVDQMQAQGLLSTIGAGFQGLGQGLGRGLAIQRRRRNGRVIN